MTSAVIAAIAAGVVNAVTASVAAWVVRDRRDLRKRVRRLERRQDALWAIYRTQLRRGPGVDR
jgi:hypothetical protein